MDSSLQLLIDIVNRYDIHLLNGIFLFFTLSIVIFGSSLIYFEGNLPHILRHILRYGKHGYNGPKNFLVLQVPKSWFKHFYITAIICSILTLLSTMRTVAYGKAAEEYVLQILDLVTGGPNKRSVQTDSNIIFMVSLMLFTQCARRFYETQFVQIFSKDGKINLSHYLVGHLHYIGVCLAVLAYTPGFVRGTKPPIFNTNFTLLQYTCIYLFYLNWVFQMKSNVILAGLRVDKRTNIVSSDRHSIPKGALFEFVSSPHMLTEVMMYLCLWALMPHNRTWAYVVTWVVSNQILNALLTHKWYKQTFTNYPKNRKAIIPFIL